MALMLSLVPLRDTNSKILQGVTIGDCGLKMGLNGVDNGTISFENVTIPKENMLDRFSVNDKGNLKAQYQVIINGFHHVGNFNRR
jgi:acyl-CoA oxidase